MSTRMKHSPSYEDARLDAQSASNRSLFRIKACIYLNVYIEGSEIFWKASYNIAAIVIGDICIFKRSPV